MNDAPLPLRLFGLDVGIVVQPERRDVIAQQWAWCAPDSPLQRDIGELSRPGTSADTPENPSENAPTGTQTHQPLSVTRGEDGDDPNAADYTLTTSLTGQAIAARAGRLIMLHAGGVSHPRTGVVAGLVAASGTGKTTATRHFCSHGYGYVTDESLIFNDARAVMPYPKPLSVLIDPERPGVKTQHSPEELGLAQPPAGDLVLGPIILLDRVRDTGKTSDGAASGGEASGTTRHDDADALPRLTRIPLFEGLTQILPQSSAMPQIPDCLDVLARLAAAGGGTLSLRYREITETNDLLDQAFSAEPEEPFWRHVPGTWDTLRPTASRYATLAATDALPAELEPATLFELAPFVDALVDDDALDVLALFGSTPARLQGLGAVAFDTLLDGPATLAALLERCTDVLGEHPDAPALLEAAVRELVTSGILLAVDESVKTPADKPVTGVGAADHAPDGVASPA